MPRDIFRLGYSVSMKADDTAELMLYGEIIPDMPEAWKWSKEDKSAADFDKAIKGIKASGATKLNVRINSPGGVCTEAVAMRSILANADFEEVNIRIEGLCASAATDIATLPGAHVTIAEGSEYMIHNPWCLAIGNANEMEHTIERLRNIEQMSRGFYVKRTGQSEEQIKEWMDAETWFTAEQAVEYGFADELKVTEKESLAAACVTDRTMAVMQSLYKAVPTQIAVSSVTPVGDTPDIDEHGDKEEKAMEIKDINMELLKAETPALLDEIRQEAVAEERQRLSDIDALTVPGYEDLAAEAKENGTSVMEFQKQIVAAMRQKGADFLAGRQKETEPAQNITGGAPEDTVKNEEQEIDEFAKEIANIASSLSRGTSDSMF